MASILASVGTEARIDARRPGTYRSSASQCGPKYISGNRPRPRLQKCALVGSFDVLSGATSPNTAIPALHPAYASPRPSPSSTASQDGVSASVGARSRGLGAAVISSQTD